MPPWLSGGTFAAHAQFVSVVSPQVSMVTADVLQVLVIFIFTSCLLFLSVFEKINKVSDLMCVTGVFHSLWMN